MAIKGNAHPIHGEGTWAHSRKTPVWVRVEGGVKPKKKSGIVISRLTIRTRVIPSRCKGESFNIKAFGRKKFGGGTGWVFGRSQARNPLLGVGSQ